MANPIKIFISYAHEDEAAKDELKTHLSKLGQLDIIKEWDDRLILPGASWDNTILSKLEEAQVFLFLVSEASLASDYIRTKEVPIALARHQAGEATVIPIIIGSCNFQQSVFKAIQAIPSDLRPLSSFVGSDREIFFRDLTIALLTVLYKYKEREQGDSPQDNAEADVSLDKTRLAGQLSKILLRLDYKPPVNTFTQCLAFGGKTFAFLVHGPRGTGHDWFLRVALGRWFKQQGSSQFKTLYLPLGEVDDTDLFSICDFLQLRNNLRSSDFQSIAKDICSWASSKTVILRIDTPSELDAEELQEVISNFGEPLFDFVTASTQAKFPLILFFVKRSKGTTLNPFCQFSDDWEQSQPLALPSLQSLKPGQIEDWATDNMAQLANLSKRVDAIIQPSKRKVTIAHIIQESRGKNAGQRGVLGKICEYYNLKFPQILANLPEV